MASEKITQGHEDKARNNKRGVSVMESQSAPSTAVSRERLTQLFALQAQCGGWGLILGVMWLVGVTSYHTAVFPKGNSPVIFGVVALLFVATIVISAGYFYAASRRPIRYATQLLHICSVLCVFAICTLIWATGGIHSPFTPFYVMTYTLTLERVEDSTNKWGIFFGFVVPIIGIWLLERYLFGSLIETVKLNEILANVFHYWAVAVGVILSILVPTLSALLEAYFKEDRGTSEKTV